MGFALDSLITDNKLEIEGTWRPYKEDSEVKVARWKNEEFAKLMRKKFKEKRHILEADDETSVKVMKQITAEVMAQTILKDVRGMTYKGEPLVYTPIIGLELFNAIEDFQEDVKAMAEEVTSYRTQQENAAVKP